MAAPKTPILTPVGRLVEGSLYKGQTTNKDGTPKVVKKGPNAGRPRVEFYFGVAFPKSSPQEHWARTPWGQVIWAVGHAAFPQGQAGSPQFAWKITDGDSAVPNKSGKKPCDKTGFPGHWVVGFSGGFAPAVWNKDGSVELKDADLVKLGDYIQVSGTVAGNESTESPGVYMNHDMVAFAGVGERISSGPDAAEVGFGQAALPAGAQPVPATAMQTAMAAPLVPGHSAPPVPAAVYAPPPVVPVVAVSPVVPVVPNQAFLAVPPGAPAPLPPAAPVRRMNPSANGHTYEQMIAAGWTDQLLVQHGHMAA